MNTFLSLLEYHKKKKENTSKLLLIYVYEEYIKYNLIKYNIMKISTILCLELNKEVEF